VVEERVGGTLDRQFVWGIRHIDDLVLRDRGSERLYAVHDAMHVTAVVNDSGAVQERYGYDGFGRPRVMTAAFAPQDPTTRDWETLFDGYRYDRETGLYQVRFRYLHAELGRWLSRDPIRRIGNSRPGRRTRRFRIVRPVNLYRFVLNCPTRFSDLLGLCSSEAVQKLAVFLGNNWLPPTRCNGIEYCGAICCNEATGEVYAGSIETAPGDRPGHCRAGLSTCREGDKPIAYWHTHIAGETEHRQVMEGMRSFDLEFIRALTARYGYPIPSFMTNPAGETTRLDPVTGEEEVIDTGGWGSLEPQLQIGTPSDPEDLPSE
jgi:RHS repeat-associated protein